MPRPAPDGLQGNLHHRCEALDDRTVQFTLSYPTTSLLQVLASATTSIMNKEFCETARPRRRITSPAARTVQVSRNGSSAIPSRSNATTNTGSTPSSIKYLTFKVIPEAASRVIALENGEIDIDSDVSGNNAAGIESNPNLKLLQGTSNKVDFIEFNTNI